MKKTPLIVLFLLILSASSQAISEEKLAVRWRYSFPEGVSATAVGNIDGDRSIEVLVATRNNTLHVYNPDGGLKQEINLGSVEDYGTPRLILIDDIDADGVNETIIGFGGRKVVTNHEWNEYFNDDNSSVGRFDKLRSRSVRNTGSVRVYDENFSLAWEYKTNYSVQDIALADLDEDGVDEIALALGAHVQDEWWELSGTLPGGGENWSLVEYPFLNGSVVLLNYSGEFKWQYNFNSSLGDVRVRSVEAGHVSGRLAPIVVAGVEDGQYRLFNATSGRIIGNYSLGAAVLELYLGELESKRSNDILAAGADRTLHLVDETNRTVWKSRFFGEVTSTSVLDIDADGINDIFAGSRDGSIYVLNSDGSQKWKYPLGDPVYSVDVADLDLNDLPEVVVGSIGNVTVLEFRSEYFTRIQADGFYDRAFREFDSGNYMFSRILLDKSENLYSQVGLTGLSKIAQLKSMIGREITVDAKIQADYIYSKALEAYGLNNYNDSIRLAAEAEKIYSELNDSRGAAKSRSLESKIRDEIRKTNLIRADSFYTIALSYLGFRNYTAAEANARNAILLYEGINAENGVKKSRRILLDLSAARYDLAQQYYLGFKYDPAISEAREAERLYMELGNKEGVNQARNLIETIKSASVVEPPSFTDKLKKILPVVVIVLVGVLLLSVYGKKKSEGVDAERIAESIEEEMGILPPSDDGDVGRPF